MWTTTWICQCRTFRPTLDAPEMLVARSFSSKRSTHCDNEMPELSTSQRPSFGWRKTSYPSQDATRSDVVDLETPPTATELASTAPQQSRSLRPRPTPSKPVTVPQQSSTMVFEPRRRMKRRNTLREGQPDFSNVSPPVAALLASTAIPPRKTIPHDPSSRSSSRRISRDDVAKEWESFGQEEIFPVSTSPAMQVLLAPHVEASNKRLTESTAEIPIHSDNDEEMEEQANEELDEDLFGTTRSASVLSMPSTDTDSQSPMSCSFSHAPASGLHRARQKIRTLSSPKSVDCGPEHPLSQELAAVNAEITKFIRDALPTRLESRTQNDASTDGESEGPMLMIAPAARKPSSLRSSLTASLNSFRMNISRTFSNFSAPTNLATDDQLLRGLLGPPYSPEMRPRPISGVPNPKLRRYLNPHAFQLYDFHLHNSHVSDADHELNTDESVASLGMSARNAGDHSRKPLHAFDAIPMQAFQDKVSKQATRKLAATTEAGRAQLAANQQQRREPRENSEFLRIAVLELQMRRAGKGQNGRVVGMGATMGRRCWWLPPRTQEREEKASDSQLHDGDVPHRWRSVLVS